MTATNSAVDLEAIIARTALKYDLLPYESKPFAQSQPARLGALAQLFGLEAAPLAKARVLELGCASGGNIIPHAVLYPEAKFVGVDLARTQVAAGRKRITALGLDNIEIHCQSFTEIGDELGQFDYIICHGVYSWVPAAVQDAIFRVIRARLSPKGVACISYNVLPGWRMMQPLRDAFMLEIPDSVDSLGRVAQARELLNFVSSATPDKGPYGDMLRAWSARLNHLPDDYIAHEFLEETNTPCTVREFARAAGTNGLGYLGECELSSMILDNYGGEIANQVRARSGNDLIATEQFIDLISGRTFRQSLLVSSERMAQVNRALSPERVAPLHFVAPAGTSVKRDNASATLTDTAGRSITTTDGDTIKGLERLVERYPASSQLDDLAEGASPAGRAALKDALYRMAIAGMVHLRLSVSDKPVAMMLARADAAAGAEFTTNLRHETVTLDATTKIILPALDGSCDHKAMADLITAEARAGRLMFSRDGEPITEPLLLQATIAEHVPGLLAGIASAGLIDG
jgi:methyltransferase-like protein/cyclopropane fatty-acyl-phospholipid synthase-like methyltransferase